ncbi:snaclec VP12 subunit A-like [Asterias rubens]|uniref:snaclec VP12 subunit A-like n=1 Tax=Asterias rubens TaxID=7604 RepID=UPI00145556D0|nr:snaclec VP12 subunit A-like [Asterias rubens]
MKFFMILMMLMLPSSGHAKCVCPKGWSVYARHCYLYVSQPEFFYNAETICLSKSLNGRESHLASVLYVGEADFIAGLAPRDESSNFWIGLKGHYPSSWQWTDGEPYIFFNWGTNYPYNYLYYSDEDCVRMSDGPTHYWFNYPHCSTNYKLPYVCKMLQRYQYRPSAPLA